MVELRTKNKPSVNSKYDNKDNAILIIGQGSSEFKNKEILKCDSLETVKYYYGENSDLTIAYTEAYEIGARDIYLCNCYLFTDYINILDILTADEYAYITPLFNFSETYQTNFNKKVYLCEMYSNIIASRLTQLIFTDKHASLYENIEQYLDDMNSINITFKELSKNRLEYGDNFCFVLNNLKKYNFANVALASILTQSNYRDYPSKDIGDVVFDINNNDVYGQELVYFAYDILAKTSIENFLNFRTINSPEKFVPIHLVIQQIKRRLNFEEFSGKLFTPYMQIQIENYVTDKMNELVGELIESYKILNINYVTTTDHTIIVYVYLSIKPYNSIEDIQITLEV